MDAPPAARQRRASQPSLDASLLDAPEAHQQQQQSTEAVAANSLPVSWLLFQQLFWFPQFLGYVLVSNLLPLQVAQLAGAGREAVGLGLITLLIQVSGFSQPLLGAWSDRLDSRFGAVSSELLAPPISQHM